MRTGTLFAFHASKDLAPMQPEPERSTAATKIKRNQFEFLHGEIEAGLVFVSAALAYRVTDPAAAMTCRAEAEDCYSTALKNTQTAGLTNDQRQCLESMLHELKAALDRLHNLTLPPSAAA